MERSKLKQLLKKEEGPKLDFKAQLLLSTDSEKKELAKDVIAMANSRGTRGYIIFGVQDKTKKIIGINPDDFREEQIQQVIYHRCDPPVSLALDLVEIEARHVAVLTIFKSTSKPHQMLQNGAFYIRRGSTTDIARRSEIANMLQENGLASCETIVLNNADLIHLDFNLINEFFRMLDVDSHEPNMVLLEAMGFIGRGRENNEFFCTAGGLLLFGKEPGMFLPHSYIKVSTYENARLFSGNILSMLDDASDYIKRLLDDVNYPCDAVEEVLANALVHRDYFDLSRGINVLISEKNIEINNPGALVAGNTVYKLTRENNPERRNPWLYQRLLTFDKKERFMRSGLGMARIRKAFENIGEVKFINIGSQNLFKVVLPRKTFNHQKKIIM